AQPPQADFL
nr:RecName: Full=44 kDa cell wall protein [Nicotiana tabacum]